MKKLIVAPSKGIFKWKEFADMKQSLQNSDYPFDETLVLVKNLYDCIRKKILSQIRYPSILFVAPSASRRNIIPSIFAELIQIDFNNRCIILNQDMSFASCSNFYQSKNRLLATDELLTPVDFYFSNLDTLREYLNRQIPIFIIDDICSTGETVVNLRKRLEQLSIPIKGIVVMISKSDYFISKGKLKLFANQIKQHPRYVEQANALEQDMEIYLDGYLPNKFTRIRQLIDPEFPDCIDKALNVIRTGANLYRKIGLDT